MPDEAPHTIAVRPASPSSIAAKGTPAGVQRR
jgi:hypothetical protein